MATPSSVANNSDAITSVRRTPEVRHGGMNPDELVRQAEELAAIGVDTVITWANGPEPARYLERVWGPLVRA